MFEAIVPPGGGLPPHIDSGEEESFLIFEGEITFRVDDQQVVATTDTFPDRHNAIFNDIIEIK